MSGHLHRRGAIPLAAAVTLALTLGQAGCDVQCRSARCVSEGLSGGGGDAGAGAAGGAGGGAACLLQSIDPPAEAAELSVAAELHLRWTMPISLDTAATAVTLTGPDGASAPLDLTLEDDFTLVVRPEKALRIWSEYILSTTADLTTTTGDPCQSTSHAFTTGGPVPEPRPLLPAALTAITLLDGEVLGVSDQSRAIQTYSVSVEKVASTGALPTAASPRSLVAAGDALAFAAAGLDGVARFSRGPLAETGILDTPGHVWKVAPFFSAGAHHLAVADDEAGVRIVSGGAGGAMSDLGTLPVATGTFTSVHASADGALIAAGNGAEVMLFRSDTPTDPASFVLAATLPLANVDVHLEGDRLFVASGAQGLSCHDVSTPESPALLTSVCGPEGACEGVSSLSASGGDLFSKIAPRKAARWTVDPATCALALASTYETSSPVNGVTASEDRALIATDEGLVVFPRDAAAPAALWEDRRGFGVAWDAARSGSHVYVAAGLLGLLTFHWPPGGVPERVDQDLTPGTQLDVAARALGLTGERLVLGDGRGGVTLFDVSTPADPLATGSFSPADVAGRMVLSGDTAYLCNDNQGVLVVDVSGPEPAVVQKLQLPALGSCQDITLSGGRLLVVGDSAGEGFFGTIDPASSGPLSWETSHVLPEVGLLRSVAARGDRLFVTTRVANPPGIAGTTSTLTTLEVPTSGAPTLGPTIEGPEAWNVAILGDFLFAASGDQGVFVFDVSGAGAPVLRGVVPTSGFAFSVRRDDDAILVMQGQGGIERFLTGVLAGD